ncbi:MAG: GvpL/GvpF family gas vesicle protein [bacterium]
MKGLYLYCIREKTEGVVAFSAKGIDGKGKVFTLPYRELEAVVSNISLEEFGSSKIQKKAQEDPIWIKEKALAHEEVIEKSMNNNKILGLIPMRFGIIFKNKARLEEILDKDYSKIKDSLEKIRGKQEWGVKVYLKDRKKFEQMIKEKNKTIKGKEKEIAALDEGMAFFMEEELKEVISREVEKNLANIAEVFFKSLKKHAVESVENKILGKELTGRQELMILNTAYLVAKEKISDFKKEADNLNQGMQTKGFYLESTGPWPAYNFTKLEIK